MLRRLTLCTAAVALALASAPAPAQTPPPGAGVPPPSAPAPPANAGAIVPLPAPLPLPAAPKPVTLGDLPDGPGSYLPKAPTDAEYVSLACIVGGTTAGMATVLAGGVAIAATGTVATAAESAIAVPVLVATVAAGCGVAQSMAPGIAWLRAQGVGLVELIERMGERREETPPAARP